MGSQTATYSRSSSKRVLLIALGLVAAVVLAAAVARAIFVALDSSCNDPFGSSDPPSVTSVEARELVVASRDAPTAPASTPLKVLRIKGRTAEMMVSRPLSASDDEYARVWQQIYAKHHGGRIVCVHLQLFWNGGDVRQYYSVGPFL